MCQIAKIKSAQSILAQVAKQAELLERLQERYKNDNFTMAINLVLSYKFT